MHRRTFLTGFAGLAGISGIAGIAGLAGIGITAGPAAAALKVVDYSPEKLQALRASGKPVLLDFYASWCTTCRAQERVVESLMGGGAYGGVTVMRVDWDTYQTSQLVKDMNIPRRSTLVLLKGDTELGRVVAQTSEASIKGLLDKAG